MKKNEALFIIYQELWVVTYAIDRFKYKGISKRIRKVHSEISDLYWQLTRIPNI